MTQMKRSNGCESVQDDEIFNLHLGSDTNSCKTSATLIDSIRQAIDQEETDNLEKRSKFQ